jgi:predicted DNA-binding antitoxin AbrB/MazE fold protein
MTRSIEAAYEHGLLRPLEPLNLSENERVTLTIEDSSQGKNGEPSPIAPETDVSDEEFEQLLDELASGPALPSLPADFSRQDVYSDLD